jgi:hypothetical protein
MAAAPSRRALTTSEELCSALMAGQAVVGLLLWSAYFSSSTVRSWFELTPSRPEVTDGFFVADLVIVGASVVSAWAIRARRTWSVVAVAFTTGLIIYPTAYLVAWVSSTDGAGVAGLWIMIPPALINPWVLARTWRTVRTVDWSPDPGRPARGRRESAP